MSIREDCDFTSTQKIIINECPLGCTILISGYLIPFSSKSTGKRNRMNSNFKNGLTF